MKQMRLFAMMAVALLSLLTLGAPRASADSVSFQLTSDHCGGFNTDNSGCLPAGGSAGTITITDDGLNTVVVSVTLNSGYEFHNGGFDVDFGFNLSGISSITYSGL